MRLAPLWIIGVLLLAFWTMPIQADDTVVNTPVQAAKLRGTWELVVEKEEGENQDEIENVQNESDAEDEDSSASEDSDRFRQRLYLGGMLSGSWQRNELSLPLTLAWFIEGTTLKLMYYYEPNERYNYRVKTLEYHYEVDGDSLTLSNIHETLKWRRVGS